MRVVGFVPAKLHSQRLPRKNVRPLGGRPLVNYVLETLAATAVDETVIYASSNEILEFVEPALPHRFIERPVALDSDDATVQDFVGAFLDAVPSDIVVLLHVTSPFIRAETVDACIEAVTSGRYDSAFAALELQRFAWYRGAPLNYRLDSSTPRTQDLEPVLVEQSGLYVFMAERFRETSRRIGDRPYIHAVDWVEGHDIDTPEEFELAELLLPLVNRP